MARPLRIEEPGMWYHVMNRGNQRRRIFHNTADYQSFLDKLAESCGLFHVEIHAYVLMPNHFHLFLRTLQANLSRFMQRQLTAYTISHNRKHQMPGHLFQGRFKSIVVDRNSYGNKVSRYIHLNPVRMRQYAEFGVRRKQRILRAFKWSSYKAYLGMNPPHPALVLEDTLAQFGRTKRKQRTAYAHFVESCLAEGADNPFDEAVAQTVLGDQEFVDTVRRKVRALGMQDKHEEQAKLELQAASIEDVIEIVSTQYGITDDDIRERRCPCREARAAALWLASKTCRGRTSLRTIGLEMGGIGIAAVVKAAARIEECMALDTRLREKLRALQQQLLQ